MNKFSDEKLNNIGFFKSIESPNIYINLKGDIYFDRTRNELKYYGGLYGEIVHLKKIKYLKELKNSFNVKVNTYF